MLLALVAPALPGCSRGGPDCYLEGAVTFRGKPVTNLVIRFFDPAIGDGGSARLTDKGTFRVPGPVHRGTYLVMFDLPPAPPPLETPEKVPPRHYPLPQKFRQENTTDLKIEVASGKNQLQLELKP
jgi:hypothetical protein